MFVKKMSALAFLAVVMTARAHSQETKLFSAKDFSISYPATWRVDTTRQYGAVVIFFSPLDGPDDTFDENVNVLTQDLKGQHINLSQYKTITEGQISKLATKSTMIKSVIEKTATGERFTCEYLMNMNGNDLHIKSICRIKNEVAYLVTLTTRLEAFERYKVAGLPIIESFKLN